MSLETAREWKRRNRPAVNEYHREWMKRNPEKRNIYSQQERSEHRDQMNEYRRNYRKRNPEYGKQRTRKIREEVLLKYGNRCKCCGEETYEFLSFDHINGRGREHRKEILMRGQKFTNWLHKNEVQEDIQILCHNCNQALGHHGFCPHNPNITRVISHRARFQ